MTNAIISDRNLSKTFHGTTKAVNGVGFDVPGMLLSTRLLRKWGMQFEFTYPGC